MYHKGGNMEAPRYDDELIDWPTPTRDYYAEEEAAEQITTAERFKELAFFSNITSFAIFMILSGSILSAVLPSFLAVICAIAVSLTLLQVSKKAIKIFLWIIKK
jgi:hypothetical protein